MWGVMYGLGMFGLGIVTGWCASRYFGYGVLLKEWDQITGHYKKLEEHRTSIENYKRLLERKKESGV